MNAETSTWNDPLAGLADDWQSASNYLSMFIDDAQTTLDEITDALLAVEAGGGPENLEQLFIAAHRLKGSAASIGLSRTAKMAHLAEDLLQDLVDDGGKLTPAISDALLMFADDLRKYVDRLKMGQFGEDHFDVLARQLTAAHTAFKTARSEPVVEAAPADIMPTVAAAAMAPDDSTPVDPAQSLQIDQQLHERVADKVPLDRRETALVGRVLFDPDLPLPGLKARLLYEKLSNLGDIRYFNPAVETLESLDELDGVAFGVVTRSAAPAVRQHIWVAGIRQIAIEPLAEAVKEKQACGAPPKAARGATAAEAETAGNARNELAAKPAETMRVDIERLDQLMNLAGQLVMNKSRFAQIANALKQATHGDRSAELLVNDLFEAIHALDRVADGVQQGTMDMRMVPIGPFFARFHRVIRDLVRVSGKDVRLVIRGEKTELDKRMIDELGDPLIHMIRNAADHGIEAPEARRAAGKPAQGTITLDACHRGGNIVIRVSDDGRGLDAERIRRKAIEKGLLSPADAETMTPQQLHQLIWLPGLSTAERVSDISGRGMGMDIVRVKIEELSGTVDLESEPGSGTTITVRLPLTLAILPSLMVEIGGEVFALPLESVAEIVNIQRREMATVRGHRTALVRKRVVPLVALGDLFGGGRDCRQSQAGGDEPTDSTMLVLLGQEDDRQIALAVDRVIGEEDVVVKSVAANYRHVAGIAGASIFGDGRVSLILDPPTLIDMSSHGAAQKAAI